MDADADEPAHEPPAAAAPFVDPLGQAKSHFSPKGFPEEQAPPVDPKEARRLEAQRKKEEALRKKKELMESGSWFDGIRKSLRLSSSGPPARPAAMPPHALPEPTHSTKRIHHLTPSTKELPLPPRSSVSDIFSGGGVSKFLYKKTAFMRNSAVHDEPSTKHEKPKKGRFNFSLRRSRIDGGDGGGGPLDYSALFNAQQSMSDMRADEEESAPAPPAAWQGKKLRQVPKRKSMQTSWEGGGGGGGGGHRRTFINRVADGYQAFMGRANLQKPADEMADDRHSRKDSIVAEEEAREAAEKLAKEEAAKRAAMNTFTMELQQTRFGKQSWEAHYLKVDGGQISIGKADGGTAGDAMNVAVSELESVSVELCVRSKDGTELRFRAPPTQMGNTAKQLNQIPEDSTASSDDNPQSSILEVHKRLNQLIQDYMGPLSV